MRKVLVSCVLVLAAAGIAALFWSQELKYALPTPVPAHFAKRSVHEYIDVDALKGYRKNIPVYIHFFNPDCPCSRFNIQHFRHLVKTFSDSVQIFAVVPAYADVNQARVMIDDENIPVIKDIADSLAHACGVYATPQAVIIDKNQKLFYRGNYNTSRYCSVRETNFAEISLKALVAGKNSPVFDQLATKSYGCEFPTADSKSSLLMNLFQ
jgi:hypothetical protein